LPAWAGEIGCTTWSQVLLKFALSHPVVTCVIPGSGAPEHMAQNALAGSGVQPDPAWWRDSLSSPR
jgi:diketogulonate reductase-like aldo/keto reductase